MKSQQQGQKGQSQQGKSSNSQQDKSQNKSKVKSTTEPAGTPPQTQQAGYSSAPEQEQTKREQENMHSERKLGDLNADEQEPRPNEADKPAGKSRAKGR